MNITPVNIIVSITLILQLSEFTNSYCYSRSTQCLQCYDAVRCSICQPNYYKVGNIYCVQNIQRCELMTEQNGCTVPSPGYKIITPFLLLSCTISNCRRCENYLDICDQCIFGRYLVNNTCSNLCPSGHAKCIDSITGTACNNLTNFNVTYADPLVCLFCQDSDCVSCPNTANTCIKCRPGLGVNFNNSCSGCGSFCLRCDLDYTICTQCWIQYYLYNGDCIYCRGNFETCATCLTQDYVCKSCSINDGLDHVNNCLVGCHVSNCYECSYNIDICTKCNTNYGVDSSGQCVTTNMTNCQTPLQQNVYICKICKNKTGHSYNGTCQTCTDPYCQQCDLFNEKCTRCRYGYNFYNRVCKPCKGYKCVGCVNNAWTCTACDYGYGLNTTSATCVPCSSAYVACIECSPYDYRICTRCTGSYTLTSGGRCRHDCAQAQCLWCPTSSVVCRQCYQYYGLTNNTGKCQYGDVKRCYLYTYQWKCKKCQNGYGVNFTNNSRSCEPCQISNCVACSYNYLQCSSCRTGYGFAPTDLQNVTFNFMYNNVTYSYGSVCIRCSDPYCRACKQTDNTKCSTCKDGYSVSQTTGMCVLNACYFYLKKCDIYGDTVGCPLGYYINSANQCVRCPVGCYDCFYNVEQGAPECTDCLQYYALDVFQLPPVCDDLCGDALWIDLDCDYPLGYQYDGCEDDCTVQYDFLCENDTLLHTSTCSYTNNISMSLVEIVMYDFDSNMFEIMITVSPPLKVLQISTDQQIFDTFSVSHNNITVKKSIYISSINRSEILFICELTGDLTQTTISIDFLPKQSVRLQYFATPNATFDFDVDLETDPILYNSQLSKSAAKILFYFNCFMAVSNVLSLLFGLYCKRSDAIQALLVIQFSYLVFIWQNSLFTSTFASFLPLKFTSGYNRHFVTESETLLHSSIATEIVTSPYLQKYGISRNVFLNNFNLSFVFVFVAFLFVIVTYVKWHKKQKEIEKMNTNNENIDQNNNNKQFDQEQFEQLQTETEKLKQYHFLALQTLFVTLLAIYVYFVSISAEMFKMKAQTDTQNMILFCCVCVIYLIMLFKFYFNMDQFLPFAETPFRRNFLTVHHFFVHILVVTLSVVLLIVFSSANLTFVTFVPLCSMIVYSAILRPYKETRDNVRSIVNYFVMCCFVGLKMYIEKVPKVYLNNLITVVLLFVAAFLLFLVVVLSVVFMILFHIKNNKVKQITDEEKENIKMTCELSKEQMITKIHKIRTESVFHNLPEQHNTIMNLSSSLINKNQNGISEIDPQIEAELGKYEQKEQTKEYYAHKINESYEAQMRRKRKQKIQNESGQIPNAEYENIEWNENKITEIQQQQNQSSETTSQNNSTKLKIQTLDQIEKKKNKLISKLKTVITQQNQFIRFQAANQMARPIVKKTYENKFLEAYDQIA